MNLPLVVLILILFLGIISFFVGIVFSIFLFYNSEKDNLDDLSEEDKEKLNEIIEEKIKKVELKHLYFL